MNTEWIDWFLQHTSALEWERIDNSNAIELPRRYDWVTVFRDEVPFDDELDEYISGRIGHCNYVNTGYTIIKYGVGDYIGKHVDYVGGNKVTYACELQASECGTGLTVEGTPLTEGYFSNTMRHEVKPIKAGTRISLTMFGRKLTNII